MCLLDCALERRIRGQFPAGSSRRRLSDASGLALPRVAFLSYSKEISFLRKIRGCPKIDSRNAIELVLRVYEML